MKRVFTIHGINSAGEWQDTVRPVFEPHFDYQAIRYRDYRWFGATKLVFDPWIIFLLLFTLYFDLLAGWSPLQLIMVALALGFLIAAARRAWTHKKVKKDFSSRVGPGERPHLIAHSLGTYLMAHILKKHADVHLGRVVLIGCVLPRNFNWGGIRAAKPPAFEAIRNEVGKKDWVARLAYHVKRLVPGLGHAGLAGFEGPANEVHTVGGSNLFCSDCPQASTGLIHNVLHPERGHSDAFLGRNDAVHFWLPFFWNIEPPEYHEFLKFCAEAAERNGEGDVAGRSIAEEALHAKEWRWASGTLGAFVAKQINARLLVEGQALLDEEVQKRVKRAIPLIWRAVDQAVREANPQNAAPNREILKNLNPKIASCRAAEAVWRP